MTIASLYIGIDISKKWLDIYDPAAGRMSRLLNTPEAIRLRIDEWRDADVFIVFEATGAYDTALGEALAAAGLAHARCNPARVREQVGEAGVVPEGAQGNHAAENNPASDPAGFESLNYLLS